MLCNLATLQLRHGRSVVLDGAARAPAVAAARACGAAAGARVVVVATTCRDGHLHRSRLEGRVRAIPGWYELQWDHVEAVARDWQVPADADLVLDAADDWDANVARLLDVLRDDVNSR
jgi:hypothetical protein